MDITVKSAWFLTHRIREAMAKEPMAGMLSAQVEMDEHVRRRKAAIQTTWTKRGGPAVVHHTPRLTAENSCTLVDEVVDTENSRLQTDELRSYILLGPEFGLGHGVVRHKSGQYVKGEDHNNTAESFFALLKRGHYGVFHQLSKKHLHRYCVEFAFRWNHRKVSDGESNGCGD